MRQYLAFRIIMIAASQQGRLTLWLPVFMIAGVLTYFGLRFEPPVWLGPMAFVPLAAACSRAGFWSRVVILPAAAAALGFASAQFATVRALPVQALPRGAVVITANVRGVDLLPQGRRITLSHVRLNDDPPLARALRVRLRNNDPAVIAQGDTVRLRALVEAPPPPAYPGGWDLQREAFYSGLGGYGFALGKAEVLAHHARDSPAAWLQSLRETIARRFQAVLPGAPGAVAATLLTGAPTAIPESDREAFRASGLAHLLAVAGLPIGIVIGLILGATRTALARWEYAALHWPTKQIAAVAALATGGFYMLLTGTHVPILRSFAMATLFPAEQDSLLAGTASAPYGAYHFGRIQLYYVPANMIAVPLTALWVMPAGLIALALMPLGLERLALIPMGWGTNTILFVARETAALPNATMAVPHIPAWGMALVAIGMALLGLWRGPFLSGVALIAAGLATPLVTRPPDLLVSADAHLVGVRTPKNVFLDKTSSASAFTRDAWTQYWASGPPTPMPAEGSTAGGTIECQITSCLLRLPPAAAPILLLRQYARRTDCGGAMLVIALSGWPLHCAPGVPVISRRGLHRDGATAIWLTPSGPELLTDREARGNRPWIPPAESAPRLSPSLSPAPAS